MSKDTSDVRIKFYTTENLGPKRRLTPEGFLICEDVPIARTGEMIYGPDETPVQVGRDGRAVITRSEKEVFKPDSMASIVGKPVVNDHPPVDVDPTNWKFYTSGVVMNSRRGSGDLKDYLVSDIIIWDPEMIADIDKEKREVSCGYNPEYLEVLDSAGQPIPGRGEQTDIIYNHLALVDRGRCGQRCSIGDRFTTDNAGQHSGRDDLRSLIGDHFNKESKTMAKKKPSLLARALRLAFATKDQAVFDEAMEQLDAAGEEEGEEDPVVIHNHIPDHRDDEPEIEVHNHVPDEGREDMPEHDRRDAGEEAPPWFKKHADASAAEMKTMKDAISGLEKWAKEEKGEKNHSGDAEEEAEDAEGEEAETARSEKVEDEKILGELEFEAPPGTNDKARKAKDSEYLADSFQDVVAKAEILAPGIRLPTFDKKSNPKKTFKTIDGLRRTALDLANAKPETRGLIDAALSNRSLDTKKMTADSVRTLFNAVASVAATNNNRRANDGTIQPNGGEVIRGSINSIADLNKRNRERYSAKKVA